MRILVAGATAWTDSAGVFAALDAHAVRPDIEVVVGSGTAGAERYARDWAQSHGHRVKRFPISQLDMSNQGSAAGTIRNTSRVDYGADVCLAFICGPSPDVRECIRMARKAGIETVVHEQVVEPFSEEELAAAVVDQTDVLLGTGRHQDHQRMQIGPCVYCSCGVRAQGRKK